MKPSIESVYSGVVTLHNISLILVIVELNDLTINQADIQNAYLEAYTKERFILSPEKSSLHSELKVTYSLYLKHYRGYEQVVNDFMKVLQTLFTLKDLNPAKPSLMCE